MQTFELVSKKRKPIKRNAIAGIMIGILLLVLIGYFGHLVNQTVKVAVMIVIASTFVVCLYILNYSTSFKNTIGQISFYENYIEIVINEKKEILYIDNIRNIRFKLSGYEGLNTSTFFEFLVWSPVYFRYHSGMNNFVDIVTGSGIRRYEFYIPNKVSLQNIKKIAKQYHLLKS
jgi:hypothetical protein